jgi:hypothetical protein
MTITIPLSEGDRTLAQTFAEQQLTKTKKIKFISIL